MLRLLLLCLLLLFSWAAQARQTALIEPAVIPLPTGRSLADAQMAVKFTLQTRGWSVLNEQPGALVAEFSRNQHRFTMTFSIDASGVLARYRDSVELNYEVEDGMRLIHPTYNKWVEAQMQRIEFNLNRDPEEIRPVLTSDEAVPDAMSLALKDHIEVRHLAARNPAPQQALGSFAKLELLPLKADTQVMAAPDDAANRIQANFSLRMQPIVAGWQGNAGAGGTLQLQVEILKLQFVSAANRILTGAKGESRVVLRLYCTEAGSGRLVASPLFYQQANRRGGSASLGITDTVMLSRIADLMRDYVVSNQREAVGSVTGVGVD